MPNTPTPGAAVAAFLLDLWGRVGLTPTPADLVALYDAALAEEHPRVAQEVARMLPDLVVAGVASREEVSAFVGFGVGDSETIARHGGMGSSVECVSWCEVLGGPVRR